MRRLAGVSIAVLALMVGAGSASAQTYTLSWWTVDGGGAMGTTGGTYALSGTAGQPDAAVALTGGTYSLSGGFWPASLGTGGPRADLSVTVSDAPDPIQSFEHLTYTITVTNAGPDEATNVIVADTLPTDVGLSTVSGDGWNCGKTGGTTFCTRPSLPPGPAPVITLVAVPAVVGTISNTVSVTAAEGDPVPGNNSATETTTVTAAQSDLAIAVSDGDVEGYYGGPLTYTLTVTNTGPSAGGGIVTDNFPAGLTGVTWTCGVTDGSCPVSGSGNISAGVSLNVGGTATFTATGTIMAGTPSPLANTATIAIAPGRVDPNPANDSDTEVTPVGPPPGFYTVAPCRVADTRGAPGPTGGPFLSANTTRTFPAGGRCGVPLDAKAVAIILTVVQQTELGNLRLYPAGGTVPTASAINFVPGRARANNAILKLGTDGQINVRCDMVPGSTGHVHFLFDVFGYFK